MPRSTALPFTLRRSSDVYTSAEYTSTTETIHGLLHLDGERLVIQWRVARKVDRMGRASVRSDEEVEEVREVAVPLAGLAGAVVRRRWWERGPRLVVTASDLRAFEGFTGPRGLRLAHPAQLVFRIRPTDRLAAAEFAAELELAVAERIPGPVHPSLPNTSNNK